jgi:hypothetical protein
LVKVIFPQLRKLCESRGVVWSWVDLRWGITDEQQSFGRSGSPDLLAEIQLCHPYFIGLLGDLTAIINQLYSEGSQPDSLAQEEILHEAYTRRRPGVYTDD